MSPILTQAIRRPKSSSHRARLEIANESGFDQTATAGRQLGITQQLDLVRGVLQGQIEVEPREFAANRLCADPPMVVLDDAMAHRKTESRSLIPSLARKEGIKDTIEKLFGDSRSPVLHCDSQPLIAISVNMSPYGQDLVVVVRRISFN